MKLIGDADTKAIAESTQSGARHWSDCAVHNAAAYEPGPCNWGGLNLTEDTLHRAVRAFVAGPGRERFFS